MTQTRLNKTVVLLLVLAISALFLALIWPFLMAILLAATFAGLARPLYARIERLFGGRRHLASFATLSILAVIVVLPFALLGSLLVAQTLDLTQSVAIWLKTHLDDPQAREQLLEQLPFHEHLAPHWNTLAQQAGQATAGMSKALVEGLSSITLGAVNFLFLSFVFFYSLYFLLIDGHRLLARCIYYLPLQTRDERLLLERFTSVARATLRGSLLVAVLQGTLAGIAFAVAGIPNAVFWGAVMAILSTIPNLGAALVWVPAAGILFLQGNTGTAIALAAFCALAVGSLDNILRPILVGKDTKMHELMIFFSTLGGVFLFGFPGIFIGPVIAALFVSIWEIYGVEFADVLPDVESLFGEGSIGGVRAKGVGYTSLDGPRLYSQPANADQPASTTGSGPEAASPLAQGEKGADRT